MTEPQFHGFWETGFPRNEDAVKPFESGAALIMGKYAYVRGLYAGSSLSEVAEHRFDEAAESLTHLMREVTRVVRSRTEDLELEQHELALAVAKHDRLAAQLARNRDDRWEQDLREEQTRTAASVQHHSQQIVGADGDLKRLSGLNTELSAVYVELENARNALV